MEMRRKFEIVSPRNNNKNKKIRNALQTDENPNFLTFMEACPSMQMHFDGPNTPNDF